MIWEQSGLDSQRLDRDDTDTDHVMGIIGRYRKTLITRYLTPDSWLKRLVQGFPSSHHLRVQPRKPRRRHRVEIDPHLSVCGSNRGTCPRTIYYQTFPSNSLLPPSSPTFFLHPKIIAIMSLSNKLSITDVDVKGKKVLIRVSTRHSRKSC